MKPFLIALFGAGLLLLAPAMADAQGKSSPRRPPPPKTTATTATPERPSTGPAHRAKVYVAHPSGRQATNKLAASRSHKPITRPRSDAVWERPASGVASRPAERVQRAGATGKRNFRKPRPRAGNFSNALGRDPARDAGDFTDAVGGDPARRAGDFTGAIGRDPARDAGDFTNQARGLRNIITPSSGASFDTNSGASSSGLSNSSNTLTPPSSLGRRTSTSSTDSAISLDPPDSGGARLGDGLNPAERRGPISDSRSQRPPQ